MNGNSEQGSTPQTDDFPNDFSRTSPACLEDVLLEAFPDIPAVHRDEVGDFVDRCVRYIGELPDHTGP
ncbi:hypothetical protein [Actinomadura kijaniata]|uniref:hypothetical protein n=1 Tax=Actinomadura kijaniata TaxID=46161 RepID=UPI00082F3D5B|nr:hypothetical protein [Actinomadura kijaniata]